jgi:hypothetical protein
MYQCEFSDARTFIRHLRVHCVSRGYRFYATGTIPPGKDPRKTDAKIINHYNIDISKWSRVRRKRRGLANVHYLRYGTFFVLMATRGSHRFFQEESALKDMRRQPLLCFGIRINAGRGRRIERSPFCKAGG